MYLRILSAMVCLLLLSTKAFALSTIDLSSGATPSLLVTELIDVSASNVTYSNIRYRGANNAAGTFTGGVSDGLGIERGIVLSTGSIANAIGPNKCYKTTTINQQEGDVDLDRANGLGLGKSMDAAVLEFDFMPSGDKLEFNYVFASEEYTEFVNSTYNDAFAFFLNGQNIALIPNTTTGVAINSVNHKTNKGYYKNNAYPTPSTWSSYFSQACKAGSKTPYFTELDGFTTVLTAKANVTPGQIHHIKLVIADLTDYSLDSMVFIQGKSFKSSPPPLPVLKATTLISPGTKLSYNTPTYTWNAVTNSTKYKLQVKTEAGQIMEEWYTPEQAGCANSGTCSITPSAKLADGTYQWSIQTFHPLVIGPWSESMTFKIKLPVIIHKVYAVHDAEMTDSQFLEVDPKDQSFKVLGQLYQGDDIEAITAHPITKELYAGSGKNSTRKGTVYKVDKSNANLSEIGQITFGKLTSPGVSALSFNPSNNVLWGWSEGGEKGRSGLFKANTDELSKAEIVLFSPKHVEDITWNKAGTQMYLAQQDQLLVYDGTLLVSLCLIPHEKIESLTITPEELLLIGIHGHDVIYRLDPAIQDGTKECIKEPFIPTGEFDDIEGLIWVTTIEY